MKHIFEFSTDWENAELDEIMHYLRCGSDFPTFMMTFRFLYPLNNMKVQVKTLRLLASANRFQRTRNLYDKFSYPYKY